MFVGADVGDGNRVAAGLGISVGVEDGAAVGDDVRVGDGVNVGDGVAVGDGVWVGVAVSVGVGDGVSVGVGVRVGVGVDVGSRMFTCTLVTMNTGSTSSVWGLSGPNKVSRIVAGPPAISFKSHRASRLSSIAWLVICSIGAQPRGSSDKP